MDFLARFSQALLRIFSAGSIESVRLLIYSSFLIHLLVQYAESHGTMVDPVSRNSLWRVDSSAPINYNDIELFCGGIGVITQSGGRCGVCGDPITMKKPRPHETGGFMVMNKTVKNYFPGSTIDVIVNLDTNHGGTFEFELCRRDSFSEVETDECFQPLSFVEGGSKKKLRTDHTERGLMSMSLKMPEGLQECRACVLRWNYRAGNNWGICKNGTAATGCGPQELYRNCADISIGYQNYFYAEQSISRLRRLIDSSVHLNW